MHAAAKLAAVLAALAAQPLYARGSADLLGPPDDLKEKYQSSDGPRMTVFKLHPVPMALGLAGALANAPVLMLPMELERAVHPNVSLYGLVTPVAVVSSYGVAGGVAVSGGVRAYFSGHAPDGFWLGGQASASLLSTGSGVDLQPQAGYQWVLDNGFTIEVGAGLSLASLVAGQGGLTFVLPVGFAW